VKFLKYLIFKCDTLRLKSENRAKSMIFAGVGKCSTSQPGGFIRAKKRKIDYASPIPYREGIK